MKKQLLAFDLDGTLLDKQSQLAGADVAAIARARSAGLDVILVTGRSWRSTREFYHALNLTGPAICYLGALVVADGAGRVLSHRPLVPDAWAALRRMAVAEGLSVTAAVGADLAVEQGRLPDANLVAADTAYATCKAPDFVDWEGWNTYTELTPDLGPCKTEPTMAAVYGDRAARRVLEAFPNGLPHSQFDLSDHITGETVLHIWHEAVDKGRALADYCRGKGIPREAVAAFGDHAMDLTMVRFAGLGVAMPDGDAALKAAATWVATPAEAIEQILKE